MRIRDAHCFVFRPAFLGQAKDNPLPASVAANVIHSLELKSRESQSQRVRNNERWCIKEWRLGEKNDQRPPYIQTPDIGPQSHSKVSCSIWRRYRPASHTLGQERFVRPTTFVQISNVKLWNPGKKKQLHPAGPRRLRSVCGCDRVSFFGIQTLEGSIQENLKRRVVVRLVLASSTVVDEHLFVGKVLWVDIEEKRALTSLPFEFRISRLIPSGLFIK
ncbi:hypothetical protein GALMADRAFT_213539 [Galerina marginata CBS 339.88]|uniref:Uncharacterized protein n=1 Tax=Galerina marginata (strain CBS 339.88) TaxID=685588 RepID=A0A067SME6_GALM3|nr:hypothetical protein GALMADRAFT_213539 [Galerina marginata CBS 339.88]